MEPWLAFPRKPGGRRGKAAARSPGSLVSMQTGSLQPVPTYLLESDTKPRAVERGKPEKVRGAQPRCCGISSQCIFPPLPHTWGEPPLLGSSRLGVEPWAGAQSPPKVNQMLGG